MVRAGSGAQTERAPPLGGCELPHPGAGVPGAHAAALLRSLGARVGDARAAAGLHPALEWARCGAMALTGQADGPPLLAPGPLASAARGAALALGALGGPAELDGAALLGERAALLGLARRGAVSPGGSCRLLRARDGWLALNLARADDRELLPAWLEDEEATGDPWGQAEAGVARGRVDPLVERARLLGLAAAPALEPDPRPPPWLRIAVRGPAARAPEERPLVLDLSSLWAGPLCAHLLGLCGARVVKVESTRRPDGTRRGPAAFRDLLDGGKESVALDLRDPRDIARLRRLVERARIVVESARPRALAQLGLRAEECLRTSPGLTWVSITGYGRAEPRAQWVAFGDDAGVAAGLAVATGSRQCPLFCGDAIADPLTGLHAAVAALASQVGGGGHLLDLSLRDVAAHALGAAPERAAAGAEVRPDGRGGWEVHAGGASSPVLAPRARRARGPARPLGADTEAVLRELAGPC